jgi:hypothetical protein
LVASDFSAFGENVLHEELRREAAVDIKRRSSSSPAPKI